MSGALPRLYALLPALLLTWLLSSACAIRSHSPGNSAELAQRARRAATALEGEDFAGARDDLKWLASRCDAAAYRERALLLLAATELDPANPLYSPAEAARASAALILADEADEDRLLIARSLYRLAGELEQLEETADVDEVVSGPSPYWCAAGGEEQTFPSLPDLPATERTGVRALQAAAASSSDSVAVLRRQVDSLRAELDRIAAVLTEDVAGTPADTTGTR